MILRNKITVEINMELSNISRNLSLLISNLNESPSERIIGNLINTIQMMDDIRENRIEML
jgi:hypothetical protein